MIQCKACSTEKGVKNGINNSIQRYQCKECSLISLWAIGAENPKRPSKSFLRFEATRKASFNKRATWLNHSPFIIYRWVVEALKNTPDPEISDDIQEMEFDTMGHFVGSKK